MRLFIAVRAPQGVVGHITLRFLGEVDDDVVPDVVVALEAGLAGVPPCEAVLGTKARRLGAAAVVLPVAGLDGLGAAVHAAMAPFGGDSRPFHAHLTLTRVRRGRPIPALAAPPAPVPWRVEEVELLRSDLGQGDGGTARHTVVATVALATGVQ